MASPLSLLIRPIIGSDGCLRMRHVGDGTLNRRQFGQQRLIFQLRLVLLFAKLAPLFLPLFTLFGRLGLPNRFGDRIGLSVQFLDLLQFLVAQLVQFQESGYVGHESPVLAILLHGVRVFHNKFSIEHLVIPCAKAGGDPERVCSTSYLESPPTVAGGT